MSQVLEKKAKEKILEQMDELNGEITTEAVIELLRPHYIFNIRKLREQALRRTANNLMATYRDDKGTRKCFSIKSKNGESKYVNIETTKDLEALRGIEDHLNSQYEGLNISKKKIQRRKEELSGQISFKEVKNS
ncbi:hypothetical protein CLPUN_35560 [Clostridium puniceum]|uniref:Uncharacterized protein n=1 Tax=Clostridium puniceum TaxID=29367 RepID=A0A1S8TBX7_9CLOT|nr:hypothetical protein [Clostridium puniceum]OOM75119.1 hypothetical protein CLPUN_35560 [Clostridium puniceum]